MRNLVIILFFLAANLGSASVEKNERSKNYDAYEDATIHFLDGASIRGYGKIIGTFKIYKIKFKLRLDGEASKWGEGMVKGITMHRHSRDVDYNYVSVMHKSRPSLLEVIEIGSISIFIEETLVYKSAGMGGNPNMPGFPATGSTIRQEIEIFLLRTKDKKASNLEAVLNFKKAALEFFEDCPVLVKRIKNRTYGRGDSLEMAYYYNDFCAEY